MNRRAIIGFNLIIFTQLSLGAVAQSSLSQETVPPQPFLAPPYTDTTECLSQSTDNERFFVEQIKVLGNTVLQAEIEQLIQPFEKQLVTLEALLCLRSKITQLYTTNGYFNSGAFLPNNQNLSDGIVEIQIVEGKLERIEISGLERLQDNYVRSRLELATTTPLNQQRLQEALELLQLNPLLEQVNAELTAGSTPGQSILIVNLKEAPAFHATLGKYLNTINCIFHGIV